MAHIGCRVTLAYLVPSSEDTSRQQLAGQVKGCASTRPRLPRVGCGPGGASALAALYQLTHAEVMFSRSDRVGIGPARNGEPGRTHSVL